MKMPNLQSPVLLVIGFDTIKMRLTRAEVGAEDFIEIVTPHLDSYSVAEHRDNRACR